ncbi:hypothetical protein BP6252_12545 [Coleophoma cylindrospora]|uniref:Uncharacterized protein n=1 Tax=Coleophoma cylindrospora TaxID=1849047 RepID=A0A3D8QCX8_9HELO|nr:hypothetical protein BP6252_12545 [Coleophoma cylindrospora]
MIEATYLDVLTRYPVATLAAGALLILLIRRLSQENSNKLSSLPTAPAKTPEQTSTEWLMESKLKFPDTPFVLPLDVETWVILPHSLLNEVKAFPSDKVNFMRLNYERMQGRYTGIGQYDHDEGVAAIRNDLTRNIARVISDLQDEASFALDKQVGDRPEWKEMWVYGDVLQTVSRLSARTFVGYPLCRDEEWINKTINLTTDTLEGVNAIKKYHPWIRDIAAPFIPELRRIKENQKFIANKLRSQVTSIIAAAKESGDFQKKPAGEDVSNEEVTDENHNLVHWVIKNFKDPEKVTAEEVGLVEIGVAFAAIHTTSMALSFAIFDLAARPEYIPELRKEIEGVIAEENYPDRKLRKTSMPKLKKLDSFVKESQRWNPPGMINMGRLVTAKQGVTLSTGQHLPKGTFLGFGAPFAHGNKDPPKTVVTAKSQPPLSEFYPWRFSDLRTQAGQETLHLHVSSDNNDTSFGVGRNACPGRFFASNEIKTVLIELIKRYDIGIGPQGQGAGGEFSKPEMLEFDTFYAPDPYAKIYVRNRQV